MKKENDFTNNFFSWEDAETAWRESEAEVARLKRIMVETWEGLLRPAYPPMIENTPEQSRLLLQFIDPIEVILQLRILKELEDEN